jgi:hypothetical protein
MTANKEAMLAEMYRLGHGLVVGIQSFANNKNEN